MTLPRHDDQLIQVIALPTQLADEVIHAVDDRHILVHGRVPHILAERLMRLLRLERDVFLLPPRYIAFDGALAFADGFTDGFVAGPALVGARVFQPHQYSVGGQLAGA